VLVVALAVVSYVASNYSSGERITELESQVYWRNIAKPVQIHAASSVFGTICGEASKGGYQLYIKNAEPYDIYLKSVAIGGEARTFCIAGSSPAGPIKMPALGSRLLSAITSSGATACEEGKVEYLDMDFAYNKTGIPEMSQNGSKQLVLQCTNTAPISESQLAPAGTAALEAVSITTSSLPEGTVGVAYSATLSAAGGTPPYTWSSSGLPAGLSLGALDGALSGTPTTEGDYGVTFVATDYALESTTASLSMAISPEPIPPLEIKTDSLPDGVESQEYSALLDATGGSGSYSWTAEGLPERLEIVDNAIMGMLGSKTAGTYELLITVEDTIYGDSASTTLKLTVTEK
jgi:hypothetical protein